MSTVLSHPCPKLMRAVKLHADSLRQRYNRPQQTCSNCGRTLCYGVDAPGDELCQPCSRIEDAFMQIWECSHCGTYRIYGHGTPASGFDREAKLLKCVACREVSEHHFSHSNGG